MSRRVSLFVPVLLFLFAGALTTSAWGGIPNLTPMEERMMGGIAPPVSGSAVPSPHRYVAPGLECRESVAPRAGGGSGEPGAIRESLLRSRPGGRGLRNGPLVNGDFESGDFTGWITSGALGTGAPSVCGTAFPPDAIITVPRLSHFTFYDPCLNLVFQGQNSAQLGDSIAWGFDPYGEPQCSDISQDVVIPAGTANFNFAYAVLASNPGHGYGNDPYFNVNVLDVTTNTVLYDVIDYTTSYNPSDPCNPWCGGDYDYLGNAQCVYRCWTTVSLDLSSIAGHTVRLSLRASDCSPNAHFCEAFLDGAGIACPDSIPPEPTAISGTCRPDSMDFCAELHWTAPSDSTSVPDSTGENCVDVVQGASAYDLRWSTAPIVTPSDFDAASQVSGEPAPGAPGTPESMVVCGLPAGPVYFALESMDPSFNASEMTTTVVNCTANDPPDCSQAAASLAVLWPPNHQFVPVSIIGVTDPDGDEVTITIDAVTQDEPTNTNGDGNFCPDARLVDGGCELRAERTGDPHVPGNGRVYAVSFTAADSIGATCTGVVYVCVPHDQGPGHGCIDDGQYVNSLECDDGLIHFDGATTVDEAAHSDAPFLYPAEVRAGKAAVKYSIPRSGAVRIHVFDLLGRRIALLEDAVRAAGVHEVLWNARAVPNGIYYVRLESCGATLHRRCVILK